MCLRLREGAAMQTDARDGRAEPQVLLPWGMPSAEAQEGEHEGLALWLSGGVSLLVWTGLAVLLTAA
jgi:hypothetical protein